MVACHIGRPGRRPTLHNSDQLALLKRPMSSDSPIWDVTTLSHADLDTSLRCFIMDLEDGDELTDADTKAMASLPPRLQGLEKCLCWRTISWN